jgi:uncharacterized protein YndB with AHSA1/START domain
VHLINVGAGQDAVFDAVSTAEGWSRWFTPEVRGDFSVGGEVVCELVGRTPVRLRMTSIKPADEVAWTTLEGPFAAAGATTAIRLSAAGDGRTSVRLEHDTPPIREDDLAACNTYWGILLGQLRHYCQTRDAATVL